MEHTLLCVLLLLNTLINSGHSEDDDGVVKAVLTIHPNSSQIFSGESVTLRCVIQGGGVTEWKYTWRKNGNSDSSSTKNEHEVSAAEVSHSGDYRCLGSHQQQCSKWSDAVTLTVTPLPKASLTVEANPVFPGETVTLTCSVGSDSIWSYQWYKDRNDNVVSQSARHTITGDTLTVNGATVNEGPYWCQGERESRPTSSSISEPVTITVNALPKTTLTVKPKPAYTGETVTLMCSVRSDSRWIYQWYKDRNDNVVSQSARHTITGDTLTINGATVNEGPYWCQGERESRPTSSSISDPVTITVNVLPVASVSVSPQGLLYSGETVTLQCDIPDYTDWTYYWYKNNQHLPSQTSKVIDIIIHTTQTGQAGQYRCEGLRTDRHQRSQPSDDITISVTALPKATLTVEPNPVFPGETVTLTCSVGSDSIWNYQWYKDWNDNVVSQSGYSNIGVSHTISRADVSDQGQYWCEGNRVSRPTSSQPSNAITLTVKALPKATLTVKPNPAYTGETVTLTCSVGSDSIWSYQWYKDRNYNVVSQSARHTITGDTLTINGATVNEGPYWCQGERESRPTSSSISDPVTITVNALPVASVSVSPRGLLYPGETVTLQCVIPDYTDWRYLWFRDNQHLPSQTSNSITFPIIQTGQYRCGGKRRDRPQRSQPSGYVTISVTALPKATLTVDPNPVFPGETVTLTCSVGSDSIWNYQWYKDRNYNVLSQSERHTITGDTLTISRAAESDQGLYWCQGEIQSRSISIISDPVTITLNALPVASVSVSPQGLLYSGETVSLQCVIPGYTDWTYYWYKNNQHLPDETSKVIDITIPITLTGQAGQYRCEGTRTDQPQRSQPSDDITISVTALPTASVKIVTPQGFLYPGETVTLQCDISDYTDWTYRWFRYNKELPSQTRKTITISFPDQAGQYQCVGNRVSRPTSSQPSNAITLTVKDYQPKTTLTSDKEDVFTGDSVTLSCTVESPGWRFYWYRHRPDSTPATTSVYSITLSWVSVSDGGQYWCRAGRGDPVYYTLYSDLVQINITERPVAVLTLQPNWTQIFIRETVTMRCDIQGGGDSDWNYRWYKNSQLVISFNTKPEYRISPVYRTNSDSYTCEGKKGSTFSKTSEAVKLTVSDQPQPVLSISPQWLNPGDSVSLSCEVDRTSTDWRFSWYRTVPYRAGLPSLSDKSYSLQPLSDNGTSEVSYTLIPAGPTPTGGYVCRAGRGDPVYDTLYSEPQFLWSGDLQPSVSLTVNPNRTQHFRSKSLSLICELKGNSTGWRLKRYTETAWPSECPSTWRSITESTCTITSLNTWYSGVFWCESGSGEYSNAVNITVNDGDVILESPVHPLTEGDSVTLTCTFRYQGTNPNPKTDFYKDGELIKNETTGEMTIPAVSKSDEGFYKCKSGEGESPESWVTVRVVSPGSSTSVLVGVVVGLLVAGVLLVILLVLLVRYKNRKGSCFNRKFWPPQPQSTNQDPQQDQGSTQGQAPDTVYTCLHGDTNIYDTINPSDHHDNDAAGASAAGPSHVTYAQIQLKKLDKKKKEKRNYPEENPVYSEVKTGKATAAAGPVDVTYADVVLQKKTKAKKKRKTATPPEADSVYSQVKPRTAPAAGPVDVTYAEVDLQKKTKAKKKRETPPETDSVYSIVKPYTDPAAAGPVDVTYAEVDLQKRVKAKKKRETATPPEADSVYSRVKPRSCHGP
ncbi:basement membrane-specific heparan sulfate proteoglycan core protein-like [Salvelinus alpinus]